MILLLGLVWAAALAAYAGSWTLLATIPIILALVGRKWLNRHPPADRGPRTFTGRVRRAIVDRDGGRCRYCGFAVHHGADCPKVGCDECYHADHVVSWDDGGATVEGNGVTSCRWCNLRKGAMPVEDFVSWLWSPEGRAELEKRRARVEA